MGILGAAGVVFFAFIGFDAVSTAAQEAKDPKRDMPIGILGSLVVCTVLYVLFSHVLSGVATVQDFRTAGKEASVAYAITTYMTGYGGRQVRHHDSRRLLIGDSGDAAWTVAGVLLDEQRRPRPADFLGGPSEVQNAV
jgi:amino acid transporter